MLVEYLKCPGTHVPSCVVVRSVEEFEVILGSAL